MIETRGAGCVPSIRSWRESSRTGRVPNLAVMTSTTEITVLGGERYHVQGDAKDVERKILDAARGSIMELAWLIEAASGESIGVNPECVVMLRTVRSE
jgi:hypothetical protein